MLKLMNRATVLNNRQFVGANCLFFTGIGARPTPNDLLSFANGLSSHHQRKGKTGGNARVGGGEGGGKGKMR